jgi:hypothetical protein
LAEVGLRWWRRDAAMNRTEDLNVKVCEEANGYIIGDVWSCREARRPDRCRVREQEGRSWVEAISRHRDAAVTHWGNDCGDDEGNRLAAAVLSENFIRSRFAP